MLDVTLWGALIAGLLSFASPCILPLVPPYLAFVTGSSIKELTDAEGAATGVQSRAIASAVAFALGFATLFTIMGAGASAIGQALGENIDWLRRIAGVTLLLFGLHFLGAFKLLALQSTVQVDVPRPAGLFGAYLVGLAFALGWSPCAGPVLAAILFTAGTHGDPAYGALLLFVYSIGIGVPFITAAAFVGHFIAAMKRFRSQLGYIERVMGVLLVATGILFLTDQIQQIGGWLSEYVPTLESLS